ncbi:hypothetical protein Rumeso_01010 [Rubellimicrobium mesophilum DSM 19309]|uniref:Secreted protein n=1 Tax=Rubellimicrobium mesophilum DSM 19309 TaxID=442562 RepID=A0A017HT11_9RHOB|nr:DUF6636 domain-containing protein [Rubellimicrobium mesophilum]EYD77303.1 hypothetical protein Rumeso_01010 [Rubellimicrobium mesophilum DSM 19309]
MTRALLLAVALVPAGAAADTLTFFRTPSDNIHCMGVQGADGTFVDCEILQRNDSRPLMPRPADCDLEWGDRFTVSSTGPAGLGCHGDTVRDPNGAVLPYGQAVRFGPIACSVTEQGLTCQNASGHGFFLSRAAQQLF